MIARKTKNTSGERTAQANQNNIDEKRETFKLWTFLHDYAWESPWLPSERALLTIIALRADNQNRTHETPAGLTYDIIGEKIGVSSRQAKRIVDSLEERGAITKIANRLAGSAKNRPNRYRLNIAVITAAVEGVSNRVQGDIYDKQGDKQGDIEVSQMSPTSDPSDPSEKNNNNNRISSSLSSGEAEGGAVADAIEDGDVAGKVRDILKANDLAHLDAPRFLRSVVNAIVDGVITTKGEAVALEALKEGCADLAAQADGKSVEWLRKKVVPFASGAPCLKAKPAAKKDKGDAPTVSSTSKRPSDAPPSPATDPRHDVTPEEIALLGLWGAAHNLAPIRDDASCAATLTAFNQSQLMALIGDGRVKSVPEGTFPLRPSLRTAKDNAKPAAPSLAARLKAACEAQGIEVPAAPSPPVEVPPRPVFPGPMADEEKARRMAEWRAKQEDATLKQYRAIDEAKEARDLDEARRVLAWNTEQERLKAIRDARRRSYRERAINWHPENLPAADEDDLDEVKRMAEDALGGPVTLCGVYEEEESPAPPVDLDASSHLAFGDQMKAQMKAQRLGNEKRCGEPCGPLVGTPLARALVADVGTLPALVNPPRARATLSSQIADMLARIVPTLDTAAEGRKWFGSIIAGKIVKGDSAASLALIESAAKDLAASDIDVTSDELSRFVETAIGTWSRPMASYRPLGFDDDGPLL